MASVLSGLRAVCVCVCALLPLCWFWTELIFFFFLKPLKTLEELLNGQKLSLWSDVLLLNFSSRLFLNKQIKTAQFISLQSGQYVLLNGKHPAHWCIFSVFILSGGIRSCTPELFCLHDVTPVSHHLMSPPAANACSPCQVLTSVNIRLPFTSIQKTKKPHFLPKDLQTGTVWTLSSSSGSYWFPAFLKGPISCKTIFSWSQWP